MGETFLPDINQEFVFTEKYLKNKISIKFEYVHQFKKKCSDKGEVPA